MIYFERCTLISDYLSDCLKIHGLKNDLHFEIEYIPKIDVISIHPEFNNYDTNKNQQVKEILEDLSHDLCGYIEDLFPDRSSHQMLLPGDLELDHIHKSFKDYFELIKSKKAIKKYNL